MVDPLVDHDIVNRWSLGRVIVKNLRDEVPGRITDGGLLREAVGIHTNTLVGRLDI